MIGYWLRRLFGMPPLSRCLHSAPITPIIRPSISDTSSGHDKASNRTFGGRCPHLKLSKKRRTASWASSILTMWTRIGSLGFDIAPWNNVAWNPAEGPSSPSGLSHHQDLFPWCSPHSYPTSKRQLWRASALVWGDVATGCRV